MAEYRVVPGTFSVTPVKTSYASGEDVELRIKCQLQRRDGLGVGFHWASDYKIYDKVGTLLASDSRSHIVILAEDLMTVDDDFTISLGAFSAGTLEGYVVASAHG